MILLDKYYLLITSRTVRLFVQKLRDANVSIAQVVSDSWASC